MENNLLNMIDYIHKQISFLEEKIKYETLIPSSVIISESFTFEKGFKQNFRVNYKINKNKYNYYKNKINESRKNLADLISVKQFDLGVGDA